MIVVQEDQSVWNILSDPPLVLGPAGPLNAGLPQIRAMTYAEKKRSDGFAAAELVNEILEGFGYRCQSLAIQANGQAYCLNAPIRMIVSWRSVDDVVAARWTEAKELIKAQVARMFPAANDADLKEPGHQPTSTPPEDDSDYDMFR